MAEICKSISTDATGQELSQTEWRMFDAENYRGDVQQYIGACITFHWHEQMEIFFLESGEVELAVGEQRRMMHPGEGCFINAGQIHAIRALGQDACLYFSMVFAPGLVGGSAGSIFDARYVQPLIREGLLLHSFLQCLQWHSAFRRHFRPAKEKTRAMNSGCGMP